MNQEDLLAMEGPHLPGLVVLGRSPSSNAYQAVIENSFSMDISADCAHFFWSSDNATSNLGGRFKIDGRIDAERYQKHFSQSRPDMIFEVFDIADPGIPVLFDWDGWRKSSESADTLSGVKDKYGARNPKFYMKDI